MNEREPQAESSRAAGLRHRLQIGLERLHQEQPDPSITEPQAAALLADLQAYVDAHGDAIGSAINAADALEWRERAFVYALQSLARVGGVSEEYARTLLHQLQDRANELPLSAPAPEPTNAVSRLCRRYGAHDLDSIREVTAAFALSTRREARGALDHLIAQAEPQWDPANAFSTDLENELWDWADGENGGSFNSLDIHLALGVLISRAGEPSYDEDSLEFASPEGARSVLRRLDRLEPREIFSANAFARVPQSSITLQLYRDKTEDQLLRIASAREYLRDFDAMRPSDAFDTLARRFGREDLAGNFTSYEAAQQLAALCRNQIEDAQIHALFCTAGLEVFLTDELDARRRARILIDERPFLRETLHLADSAEFIEALRNIGELSRTNAIRLLGRVLPWISSASFETFAQSFAHQFATLAWEEGILLTGDPTPIQIKQAISTLFRRAGFPSLQTLNHEEAVTALSRVSPRLARIIVGLAEWNAARKSLRPLIGIEHGSIEWKALEKTAKLPDVPSLTTLSSRALTPDAAWRAVCSMLGCNPLADQRLNDAAHSLLAVEVAAADNPIANELATVARVRGEPHRIDVAQRRAWRALAAAVGRYDLAGRLDGEAMRELVDAILAYRGSENLEPLIKDAALERMVAHAIAQRRNEPRKGKAPERASFGFGH